MKQIYCVIGKWGAHWFLCEQHRDEKLAADPDARQAGQAAWHTQVCEACP